MCWRFLAGRCFTVGQTVEVDSDQTETLIENSEHYTMWEWEIADILEISKSIKLLVKMKNVSFLMEKNPQGLFGQPNTIWKACPK